MKYTIIESIFLPDFEEGVNAAIEQGWIPLGGVSYSNGYPGVERYVQAMVFGGEE